jgi:hypothetical protein
MPPQAPVTVPLNVSAVATLTNAGATAQVPISVRQLVIIPDALTGSFPLPTIAGNCVVVVVNTANAASAVPSITGVTLGGTADNFKNGSTGISTVGADNALAGIWVDNNCKGGATAIAVTGVNLTMTSDLGITIMEIGGLLTVSPVDQISNAAATGTSTPTSGTTPATTVVNEIWIAAISAVAALTFPASPPWTNFEYEAGGEAGGGYQIVNATGTATYLTGGPEACWAGAIITLKGITGAATAQIGPVNKRETWYPESISVSVSTAVNQATCNIYAGPDTSQANFIDSTPQGSSGFTTYPTANRIVRAGEYVFAIWTGGDVGSQARVNIQGTKTLGSGGAPGWQHVRTRAL